MAIFGTMSTMFFEISHWIFAYKYWIMSYRIQALMDGDSKPNLTCQERTNLITLISEVFWSILTMVLFLLLNFKLDNQGMFALFMFYFSLWTNPFFDGFACWLLFDAFKRMKKYAVSANMKANTRMMHIHMTSYALLVLSLLFYFASNVGGPSWFVDSMTIFVCITSLAS
jgi:hypothetical protein